MTKEQWISLFSLVAALLMAWLNTKATPKK